MGGAASGEFIWAQGEGGGGSLQDGTRGEGGREGGGLPRSGMGPSFLMYHLEFSTLFASVELLPA